MFDATSDTGLRLCLTVCVEDAWQGERAAAAAAVIGDEIQSICRARWEHRRLPVGVESWRDVLGEAWLRVRSYARTLAGADSPRSALVALISNVSRDLSRSAAPPAELLCDEVSLDVAAETARPLPGSPDPNAVCEVEWDAAPFLSALVSLLVAEGVDDEWARTAIEEVAQVAASSASPRMRRHRLGAMVRHGELSLTRRQARSVADLMSPRYASAPDVEPPLWRIAAGEALTAEDRHLIRIAVSHAPAAEVRAAS